MSNLTKTDVKKLVGIYKALQGAASEQEDPFGGFYAGGTERLFADFESVLKKMGVVFERASYAIVQYERNGSAAWGIAYDDPAAIGSGKEPEWCLTGFSSSEEARGILADKSVFEDYDGTPPRVYSLEDRRIG